MTTIRRPGWKIVSTTIVGQLHPLLADNVHDVNIFRTWRSWPVVPHPGKCQELAIRRPRRRYRITCVRNLLHFGSVGPHDVNLWKTCASADPRDLRSWLAVPHWGNIRALRTSYPIE